MQSGAAAATAPLLAKLIKEATAGKGEAGEVARIALYTLASAVLAKAQGGDAGAGAAGAKVFAQAIYGKDADQLAPDEKMVILNLVAALSAAGGGAVTGDTRGMVSAGNVARVEVENNAFNMAGRTDEQVRAGIQRQVDGVDLDEVYGDDQAKKDAYRKGREQGVKEGFKDGIVDVVQSTADSILHPIDTVSDLITAVWNYDETYEAIKFTVTQWSELYEYALINDPELAGKMAGSLQGKIVGNIGTSIVVSGAAAKAIQKVAQMESGIKWLPDAHGKNHATIVKGDVHIPVDKIEVWLRGGAAGDVDALTSRLQKLRDERKANQRDFAKSGKADEILKIEDDLKRINRSRQMGKDLEKVGIDNKSNLNNSIIIDKLLNSTKNVSSANRTSSIVLTGSNGSVRITATWKVMSDGTKRLTTLTTGTF